MKALVQLVGASEDGVDFAALSERQREILVRYQPFHFFEEKQGRIFVRARSLSDFVTPKASKETSFASRKPETPEPSFPIKTTTLPEERLAANSKITLRVLDMVKAIQKGERPPLPET